ncbi:Cysteine protease family C48 [Phytophthora palmivora]|uniref:Cysteine protease family C48 n=1 Tax=Phytophthora palmivora TaxID=4796 RepID=A0A2P4X1Y1_9STRA|nr:Cysteine protease family C48 [Phytophthora palmivora]
MKVRAVVRGSDVCDVVVLLQRTKPGIREMGSFLATFQVTDKALKWRLDAEYVSDCARYRPPQPTSVRALEQLYDGDEKSFEEDRTEASGILCEMMESWPYCMLPGYGFDLSYFDLYCFRASTWLNGDVIRAFSVFLARCYKPNTTVVIPSLTGTSKKTVLDVKIQAKIQRGSNGHHFVLVPVNFGGVHWACLVGDKSA